MSLQAVIFDLDDTLYDFVTLHLRALESMADCGASRFGLPKKLFLQAYREEDRKIKQEQPYAAAGHNRILIIQRMMERMGLPSLGEIPLTLYEAYWGVFIRHMVPRDGAEELLKTLHDRDIRTCICTDMTAHIQHRKLMALGLADCIDYMVSSEEAGVEKPNPAMFRMCLDKMKVQPEQCMMVGDSFERDICGAAGVGITPVWLNARDQAKPEAAFAFREIHTLSELHTIIG